MAEGDTYKKFRWFVTSSGKTVIGGKSAEQNEEIIRNHIGGGDIIIHTETPGSPFAVIKSCGKKITDKDIKEAAIFCASFSQQWKKGARHSEVHAFAKDQIIKEKSQKTGTFSVIGKIHRIKAELRLVLTLQNGTLRAVPESAARDKLIEIKPGRMQKEEAAKKIREKLRAKEIILTEQEILQALPSGGFEIH